MDAHSTLHPISKLEIAALFKDIDEESLEAIRLEAMRQTLTDAQFVAIQRYHAKPADVCRLQLLQICVIARQAYGQLAETVMVDLTRVILTELGPLEEPSHDRARQQTTGGDAAEPIRPAGQALPDERRDASAPGDLGGDASGARGHYLGLDRGAAQEQGAVAAAPGESEALVAPAQGVKETGAVFARHECLFNYCPTRETCEPANSCAHPLVVKDPAS